MNTRMGRILCRLTLHSWQDVGVMGLMSPVDECRRGCGWHRVFTGHAVLLYPPGSIRPRGSAHDEKEQV